MLFISVWYTLYNMIYILLALFTLIITNRAAFPDYDYDVNGFDRINDKFIEKINSVQNSWVAGYSFPPNTKFEDLKILAGTIRRKNNNTRNIEIPADVVIPIEFDSRENWPQCKSIKKIKDQGHCGSCWAVSSATTMSDRLCISTNGKFNTEISAQEITSCSIVNGCNSGAPYYAWKYFNKHGASTGGDYNSNEGCQPYLFEPFIKELKHINDSIPGKHLKSVPIPECQSKCYNKNKKDLYKGKYVYQLENNVTQIQYNIMTYGPAVCVIDVYEDFLAYKSGVYEHKTGAYVGGHAMRIIGWGRENKKDYWLIANQWGKLWGENGLVKFRRGTNQLGVEDHVISGITGNGQIN